MTNKENNNVWIELFNQQVSEKGIQFPSEESKKEALADFISHCENNVDGPQIHVLQVAAKTAEGAKEATDKKQRRKKEPTKKEYKPEYSYEKMVELELVTKIATEQIESIKSDPNIPTYDFSNNCVIDITAAIRNGVAMLTPAVNREHGKDTVLTGDSLRIYGAQQLALVITKAVADVAGMKVTRFTNDKSNAPIKENSLVFLNGNGRMGYILGLEDEERPQLYATFIEPDALGYYNPRKAMEVINTERLMWKTQDMVQKRQLEEGEGSHEGWSEIQKLIKKGYMYQAACQAYTLDTDRIKTKDVTGGKAEEIFTHYESAKQIHDALVAKFGEGDDKTLKTKEFPKEISTLWKKLQTKGGDKYATEAFVRFIKAFKESKVKEILNAKSEKYGRKKDEIRKSILNEQFNQFIGKEGIELD